MWQEFCRMNNDTPAKFSVVCPDDLMLDTLSRSHLY